jgi:hypothetical protein
MALSFDTTPLQDTTWAQAQQAQIRHTKRIRVTGFVSSSYYEMLSELYNDPGLPLIGSSVDPLFPTIRLRGWVVATVQCGAPVPEIILEAEYSEQSIFVSTGADKDGPVVFRQRSLTIDWTFYEDRLGNPWTLTYKNDVQEGSADLQRSLMVYECDRYEDANPEPRIRNILSKVNDATWNSRAPRSVLFADFNSDTRDDGQTYYCTYSFIYDPLLWDRTYIYLGSDGLVPDDLDRTKGVGTETPEVYDQVSFSPMNIVLP